MAENEQITTELTYQSKETERVIEMNKKLIRQNGDLKRQCEVSRFSCLLVPTPSSSHVGLFALRRILLCVLFDTDLVALRPVRCLMPN